VSFVWVLLGYSLIFWHRDTEYALCTSRTRTGFKLLISETVKSFLLLTNSVVPGIPFEDISYLIGPAVLCIMEPKSSPLELVLSHLIQSLYSHPHFSKIRFSILPSTPSSSNWFFPEALQAKCYTCFLPPLYVLHVPPVSSTVI